LLEDVGTDPTYAIAGSEQGAGAVEYFFGFFNRSWYGKHGNSAQLTRTREPSYAAPPLVGVWATAPYFHNASVPTLDAVLDPALRPSIFRRSTDPKSYDFERLGWPYEEVDAKGDDVSIYDATRAEYLNTGHTFAADLTPDERRELLEYLKTL
jgi:cytochrome c peroxidase